MGGKEKVRQALMGEPQERETAERINSDEAGASAILITQKASTDTNNKGTGDLCLLRIKSKPHSVNLRRGRDQRIARLRKTRTKRGEKTVQTQIQEREGTFWRHWLWGMWAERRACRGFRAKAGTGGGERSTLSSRENP